MRDRFGEDRNHHAPEVIKAEALAALRGLLLRGELPTATAHSIVQGLHDYSIVAYPVDAFISRIWSLRDNVSVYDAWYVALAEALNVPLVTADRRLAAAPGVGCDVELVC